jgi:hypothetical protein
LDARVDIILKRTERVNRNVLIVTALQQPAVKVSTFDFIFSTVVQKTAKQKYATVSYKKRHFSTTATLTLTFRLGFLK